MVQLNRTDSSKSYAFCIRFPRKRPLRVISRPFRRVEKESALPPKAEVVGDVSTRQLSADFVDLVGCRCAFWRPLLVEADILFPHMTSRSDADYLRFVFRSLNHDCRHSGGGSGLSLASFRRFWAVAANRNSSCALRGPLSRRRPSFKIRLRWANSISTRFRSRRDWS